MNNRYALFYDTETTGLPLWSQPSSHDRQPHIVQLAAKLVDLENYRVLSAFSHISKPSGWVIPMENGAMIHGIDNFMANEFGIPESKSLSLLCDLYDKCDFVVAHNVQFDDRIIRIALKRFAPLDTIADHWKQKPRFCTAKESTSIVKLPPTEKMIASGRGGQFKKPTLSESYSFFTGRNLVGAHDALVDVDACIQIYKRICSVSRGI